MRTQNKKQILYYKNLIYVFINAMNLSGLFSYNLKHFCNYSSFLKFITFCEGVFYLYHIFILGNRKKLYLTRSDENG